MNLIYEKIDAYKYSVCTNNKVQIGAFEMDVDGFFYFWPNSENTGCYNSFLLKTLANKLDEINKPWNDLISESFADRNVKFS